MLFSAIGTHGVLRGSPNDPGDIMPVAGVLGAEPHDQVASFTLRRRTAHEVCPFN